jgi:glyoxylase-like metal-dependent hydrolase (beta-lactamase superfamily II)
MKMKFKIFPLGPLFVNTVLLWDESRKAMLVDPAGDLTDVINAVDRHNLDLVWIVNTHEHPDHIAKNAWAKLSFKDASLVMHRLARENINYWVDSEIGFLSDAEYSPEPDVTVDSGDFIELGNLKFEIIHVPGHSPGSIALFERRENVAVVGDLIFKGSIGRYDLPMASYSDLKKSILRLLEIANRDTLLIPGHGPITTVKDELLNNPFIREMF